MSADQKEKMLDACKNGKVKEIQQLLKEAPSLLEASLDSVFVFVFFLFFCFVLFCFVLFYN